MGKSEEMKGWIEPAAKLLVYLRVVSAILDKRARSLLVCDPEMTNVDLRSAAAVKVAVETFPLRRFQRSHLMVYAPELVDSGDLVTLYSVTDERVRRFDPQPLKLVFKGRKDIYLKNVQVVAAYRDGFIAKYYTNPLRLMVAFQKELDDSWYWNNCFLCMFIKCIVCCFVRCFRKPKSTTDSGS